MILGSEHRIPPPRGRSVGVTEVLADLVQREALLKQERSVGPSECLVVEFESEPLAVGCPLLVIGCLSR